jgi:choline kinase
MREPMESIKNAVILVAGEGKRLRPFTEDNPKCFASVLDRTILENALQAFARAGCQETTIVIGHMAEKVKATITNQYAGMDIRYIHNPDYATTNSMYSLSMGLDSLSDATWVLEGDVFLDADILGLPAKPDISWFVDSSCRHLDGAYVEEVEGGRACSLNIIRDLTLLKKNQYKSIGLLKLSREGREMLSGWLHDGIQAGRQNQYYDLILGDHMGDAQVTVVDVAGHKWFEIDTNEDLENAKALFA